MMHGQKNIKLFFEMSVNIYSSKQPTTSEY